MKYGYLETRSRCVNKSFIILFYSWICSCTCPQASDLAEKGFGGTNSGLYYKHILTIVYEACTINVSLVFALAMASVVNYAHK
jgi:hypothetical protein